jgi:hypothetical protein
MPYPGRTAAANGAVVVPGARFDAMAYTIAATISNCPALPVPSQNGQDFSAQFCPMSVSELARSPRRQALQSRESRTAVVAATAAAAH